MNTEEIIDETIDDLVKKEKAIVEEGNSVIEELGEIKDVFENIYFVLEKVIPHQIKGVVVMDRLNLLTSIKILSSEVISEKNIKKYIDEAVGLTTKNANLIERSLLDIKGRIEKIEKILKSK